MGLGGVLPPLQTLGGGNTPFTSPFLRHWCRCSRCNLDVAAFIHKLVSAVIVDLHLHRGGSEVWVGNTLFECIGILANRLGKSG